MSLLPLITTLRRLDLSSGDDISVNIIVDYSDTNAIFTLLMMLLSCKIFAGWNIPQWEIRHDVWSQRVQVTFEVCNWKSRARIREHSFFLLDILSFLHPNLKFLFLCSTLSFKHLFIGCCKSFYKHFVQMLRRLLSKLEGSMVTSRHLGSWNWLGYCYNVNEDWQSTVDNITCFLHVHVTPQMHLYS